MYVALFVNREDGEIVERYELAEQDYMTGMKYKDIAEKYGVAMDTVKSWKKRYGWNRKEGAHKNEKGCTQNKKVQMVQRVTVDDGTKETLQNTELTPEQQMFCIYYSRTFNATQSYLNAYGGTYDTAHSKGYSLLAKVGIKAEINRLKEIKRQQIVAGEPDIVELQMRIAFADINNALSFGRVDIDDGDRTITVNVNNLDHMEGFGLPKLWGAIPTLKGIDLCHMILNGDLEKGEKLLLTNESLIKIDRETGKPKRTNPLMRKLFVFIGNKLPDQDSLIKEYNPEIRIDTITKTFELCLSMFSMMFGFGTKQYKFENGQVSTATQYIGERQDSMKELNKQRKESKDYITGIVRAVEWFSNTFCGETFDMDAEVCIDFDDSYIEDKNTKIESMRADAQAFSDIPEFTIRYIMERFNVDRDEALKIYNNKMEEDDPEGED